MAKKNLSSENRTKLGEEYLKAAKKYLEISEEKTEFERKKS